MKFAIVFALFVSCASAGYTGPIAQVASPSWYGQSAVVASPLAYASNWNGYGAQYDGRYDGAWDNQGNWYNTRAAPLAYTAPLAYSQVNAVPLAYSQVNAVPLTYSQAYSPLAYSNGYAAHVQAVPAVAATYKAATLGATHVAPLPGHTVSRTNLNLAAPPTY